ncbi:hypothetical protein [Ottowia sp.]|uniref:hypothetical protein n=1 Tax=Ottowia sp. TaxID=1898956 RepID=UPI0026000343|nr:hypothetical protein [Ottowia sp.]MBK6616139.1 hypothetical protein [Ottowia sp.]
MNAIRTSLAVVFAMQALSSVALAQDAVQPAATPEATQPAAAPEAAKPADAALTESDIKSVANGQIDLSIEKHSPVYAEFIGSAELTGRLRKSLQDQGFVIAGQKDEAKAVLLFKGDVVLRGGPVFYKGLKLTVAEATDKALKAEQKDRPIERSDVTHGAAAVALNAAGYAHSVTNFMQGLHIGGMAAAIGDSTGMKGWFNSKLTGDPRGICLSRCEDWKKVEQAAYITVTFEPKGGDKKEVRIISKAFSETVAPHQVITSAVGKAIEQINLSDARPVVTSLVGK